MTKLGIAAGVAILVLTAAPGARGETYPAKPVRVFVTSTAGGPLDVFTRLVTNRMEHRLKQPFVIENRAGAGGNLAIAAMLQAPADGYTIGFSIDTTLTVNPSLFKQMLFDPEKDIVPVSVLAKFGQALGVPSSLPVASVKELKELSLRRDMNYGSSGIGSPAHLSFAYLQAVSGIRATHIPYRGNPPALLALTRGDTQASMVISTSLLPMIQQGKVKTLAYSDSVRSEVLPDVPTVAEQGYPGFEVVFSYVMVVPKRTPRSVVDLLTSEARDAVMFPAVREKLKAVDTVPIALTPAASAEWLRKNRAKWHDVITRMNIQAQ